MVFDNYQLLGEGQEGKVFTDGKYVYKVMEKLDNVKLLKERFNQAKNLKFFIPIKDIFYRDNCYIIKYKYFDFKKVNVLKENQAIDFAIECWKNNIVCKNIKLDNFIKTEDGLKFIDYGNDIVEYNDNLFLNMLSRLFIDIQYFSEEEKVILKRETINNFNKLKGIDLFINKVFSKLIYSFDSNYTNLYLDKKINYIEANSNEEVIEKILIINKKQITIKNFETLNFDTIFWRLLRKGIRIKNISLFELKDKIEKNVLLKIPNYYCLEIERYHKKYEDVTVLIKTCAQEYKTIDKQIKHILKQILFPDLVKEVLVLVDVKTENFLREYDKGNYEVLINKLKILKKERLIDNYFSMPLEEVEKTNEFWFGISCKETHTIHNAPVTSQLYAFKSIKSKYILQLDSDVLIGRLDYNHSFLDDMIKELEENENVISVGFNIPKKEQKFYKYFGFENGGFVPEVRFCLMDRERLLNIRPLPNELSNGKLKMTWHRSLEKKQKETNYVSIRGGDYRSYFIHPQNFRKQCVDVWLTILDRIEQGYLIDKQKEEYELVGSYYDWAIPKRSENIVIVTVVRNASYDVFLRCWISIINQTYKDFGWIIIDDCSSNGSDIFIENLIKNSGLENKITFIKNRKRNNSLSNTYKAIHYFCDNPESVIVLVDGDDALIGNDVLENLSYIYKNGADVVIGKMYRTDKIYPIYKYKPDFKCPRKNNGGNVYQHLKTFKKYLFDSIKVWDLKIENNKKNVGAKKEWIKFAADYTIMIPIVEMAKNPIFYDRYNYFHQRSLPSNDKMKKIKDKYIGYILNKKPYSSIDIIGKRRDFYPNTNRIEIDILYKCNLKCLSCNRSSAQVDRFDYIAVAQIEEFINESIKLNKKWELINILGGEPTLHPNFIEIVDTIMLNYIDNFSPKTVLQITSNGYTKKSRDILFLLKEKYPKIYIDENSFKQSNKIDYFTPFNDAPIDDVNFKNEDFSKGCWVASYCGMSLNKYGYYPCGVIGSIDSLFGGFYVVKTIEEFEKNKKNQKKLMDKYCRLCGNFKYYAENKGDFIPRCEKDYFKEDIRSETWQKIYNNFNKEK